jgi:biotin-dependent carboxylase-like uncharacterized protein
MTADNTVTSSGDSETTSGKRATDPVAVVVSPGPASIFVDDGRKGWAHLAVPRSGAYDRRSFHRANRLVGNRAAATAIEVLLGPVSVWFAQAATLALTGVSATIDITAHVRSPQIPQGTLARAAKTNSEATFTIAANTLVTIHRFDNGSRGYLAIRGGWWAPRTLGSTSTDTLSGLGPEPLTAKQHLARDTHSVRPPQDLGRHVVRHSHHQVDLHPAPHTLAGTLQAFTSMDWEVTNQADRIGTRLTTTSASRLPRVDARDVSVPLVRGAIQLTPDGHPIVMGPDHPITGGYSVIAVVSVSGSDTFGQILPGDTVTFRDAPSTGNHM